jgi:hypothetical protein
MGSDAGRRGTVHPSPGCEGWQKIGSSRRAGTRVLLPRPGTLCCGRPLYDFGMLRLARQKLRQAMTALGPYVHEGIPVVGLEPSCVAVFRDELRGLFPDDETPSCSRSEPSRSPSACGGRRWRPTRLRARALVQVRCHQHAMRDFGFERGAKYEVSVKAGQRILGPAIAEADDDTLILADGFSCRTQIRHLTGRRALHLAEMLSLALESAA